MGKERTSFEGQADTRRGDGDGDGHVDNFPLFSISIICDGLWVLGHYVIREGAHERECLHFINALCEHVWGA